MKDISSWLESRHQFLPVLQSPAFSEMEICKRLSLIAIIRVAKDQLLNWLPGPRASSESNDTSTTNSEIKITESSALKEVHSNSRETATECSILKEIQCDIEDISDNYVSCPNSTIHEVSDKCDNEITPISSNNRDTETMKAIRTPNIATSESQSGDESSSLGDDMEASSSLKLIPKPEVNVQKRSDSLALISSIYDYSSDSGSDNRSLVDGFSEHRSECFSSNSEHICSDDTEESDSDLESIIAKKPTFIPKQIKVLGELNIKDLPPIEDLHISVKEEECIPFGKVYSIVDTLLVIQSLPDKPALNLDSIFFRHNGEPIGRIFDVFGPVKRPFYSVRFNTNDEIHEKGLEIDVVLYAAPDTKHIDYVFAQQLMKQKGSDASWVNDCEPPVECIDYSDDEEERNNRRKQKMP
uniref:H/ACA ribonucleoprotein complex non-core subunit NAF1 n=1 Tax=Rhodnius prolixus TaxID=13249 RepID=T1I364_RHOPR